jgi:hypothetical protein
MSKPKNPYDRHPFFEQISQLYRNKTAIIGLIIITGFFLVALSQSPRSGGNLLVRSAQTAGLA